MSRCGIGPLANEFNKKSFDKINTRIDNNSKLIDEVVTNIVNDFCKPLDDYIKYIDGVLVNSDEPISDTMLDAFTLNLPALLYFISDAQEALGIKEDVAKAIRNEIFNKTREKSKGTVADKDACAELASQTETIANIVYARAYKKLKLRVEAGYEMLQSVKKVISRRIAEYELTKSDNGYAK